MDRDTALRLLHEFVQSPNLIRHMLAVEAAMRHYAPRFGGDPEMWGLAGLLHDFDWEIHPSLDQHPQAGAAILRAWSVPEEIVRCILSHADHTGIPRLAPMERALYACDEVTGLITAVALVRPSRSLHDLDVTSVRNKWKNSRFAAAVDRQQVERAAAEFGVDLWEHVGQVILAMRSIAVELGLAGGALQA